MMTQQLSRVLCFCTSSYEMYLGASFVAFDAFLAGLLSNEMGCRYAWPIYDVEFGMRVRRRRDGRLTYTPMSMPPVNAAATAPFSRLALAASEDAIRAPLGAMPRPWARSVRPLAFKQRRANILSKLS